ncbi:transcription antitermination factor NusB [Chlamydia ibidis]|uniref:Transcription antitermination factor NusB n=2 Tax=Chlamydia ibidis TaxID=1405396 RepID=S7J274_9CHLA|nr:transcription antitermination factor NusB [Chlamydia ibidis]EPP34524.1 transcription antitermination factor NusB [Chlamydia ibidis]EQM62366.1 transcription antitermination factor NusB [Chlamydia ibidis 10-1398/6]
MSALASETPAESCIGFPRPLPKQKTREIVLQMLYALNMDMSGDQGLVSLLMAQNSVTHKHAFSALDMSREILNKSPELDSLISKTIKNTSFDRLNLMEKNVLRLVLFEYLYLQPISTSVLIAEATRLVKKFSYKEACSFVHAVLNDVFCLDTPIAEPEHSLMCC